jgi:epoxyqueuosine reductase QueG
LLKTGRREMVKTEAGLTNSIKSKAKQLGADLIGVADIESLKGLTVHPADLLEPFTSAVAIAAQLPAAAFEEIIDRPTPIYKSIYMTANSILDQIAFRVSLILQKAGYYSLPIPASQVVDKENWHGAISHKAVARVAGIGWQGKNLLLITPEYGSRVRLVTVLTEAPLKADEPVANRCGKCTLCRDACPAKAIRGVRTETHYQTREEALNFSRCVEKVFGEFAKLPGIGSAICGICIKVCPFSRKRKNEKA